MQWQMQKDQLLRNTVGVKQEIQTEHLEMNIASQHKIYVGYVDDNGDGNGNGIRIVTFCLFVINVILMVICIMATLG